MPARSWMASVRITYAFATRCSLLVDRKAHGTSTRDGVRGWPGGTLLRPAARTGVRRSHRARRGTRLQPDVDLRFRPPVGGPVRAPGARRGADDDDRARNGGAHPGPTFTD